MKTWRVLSVCMLLLFIGTAQAAQVNRSSGLGLSRTGPNTATGVVKSSGGDFGRLLQGPARISGGGTDFEALLEMPVKLPDIPPDKAKVKQALSAANVAKALRGGVAPYLAGEGLKWLMNEACVRVAGGSMQMTESGAWEECVPGGGSTVSDGYTWKVGSDGSPGRHPTCEKAAAAWAAFFNANQTTYTYAVTGSCGAVFSDGSGAPFPFTETQLSTGVSISGNNAAGRSPGTCPAGQYVWSDGTCHPDPQVEDVTWKPIPPDAAQQKLEDAIKAPPNASRVWDAMREYADTGGGFDTELPTSVEGPAQSPASTTTSTTTQQTANGPQTLTTTNTTVITYNYAGDTITYNQTTTSVTRNEAGEVVSTSTTNGPPQPSDEAPVDTPLPPVPDLYVRKYPNGMEGIYDEYKERLKGTQLAQLASDLMPNISDGGTCPSWPLNLNLASWAEFGVHDVAPPCWIWGVGKAILILSALLLARALIFGG